MFKVIQKHQIRFISSILLVIAFILLMLFHNQLGTLFSKQPTPTKIIQQLPSHPVVASNSKDANSENILLHMQGYTVQLMGAYAFNSITHFVSTNNLEKTTHIFHSINKEQDWYTLIYGDYHTREKAMIAMQNLPTYLQKLHPWIRPMDSVHTAILQGKQ